MCLEGNDKIMCKVSIIMPSLNVVDYIDECIQSALNQTLTDTEIICIDAGSTDGTREKLVSYSEKYKDKVVLVQSDIKSYGYQVNIGIYKAAGEYVAILETDDYIEPEMYEFLYNVGIKNNVEIVKADFDSFFSFPDGGREFNRIKLWPDNPDNYNNVIDPRHISYLYPNDYNVWKGIYKRQFLLDNHIYFNESKGAAYQDIGFSQQVLACCERAYYSDKSFYRYRIDREMSSINSVHGLEYSYCEFKRLLEDSEINKKLVCESGLYRHMAQSFEGELLRTLRAIDYDIDSVHIKSYFGWFKEKIIGAIDKGILTSDIYDFDLPEILADIQRFSNELKRKDFDIKNKEQHILSNVSERKVVIFGAGVRGRAAVKFFRKNAINVIGVCDNDTEKWGNNIEGYYIFSPLECMEKYNDCVYVIANRVFSEEIKQQLIRAGISTMNIITY